MKLNTRLPWSVLERQSSLYNTLLSNILLRNLFLCYYSLKVASLAATTVRGITETVSFTALPGISDILQLHQEDSHKIHFPQKRDTFLF